MQEEAEKVDDSTEQDDAAEETNVTDDVIEQVDGEDDRNVRRRISDGTACEGDNEAGDTTEDNDDSGEFI